MALNTGFKITTLRATGKNDKVSEVTFFNGLNVISGVSDTGKSFIFECIDYMFGAEKPPRKIEESKPYETLLLEIEDKNGNTYTLERNINGGDFFVYDGKIGEITKRIPRTIASKHDKNNPDNISTFLLSLCGISSGQLIKKSDNEKVELSFRLINHFCLIDETRIITLGSPVFSKGYATQTLDKSVFNYLITGNDNSQLISFKKPQIIKAENNARLEVYQSLIAALENKIKTSEFDEVSIKNKIDEINSLLEAYSEQIDSLSIEINKHQNNRNNTWNEIQRIENRLNSIDGLLSRFNLLKEHYVSDLDRLEFISEGENFFEQLEFANCPLCNTPLTEHSRQVLHEIDQEEIVNIQDSCEVEAHKINILLVDLEKTIETLVQEQTDLNNKTNNLMLIVNNEDEIIRNELSPKIISIKSLINNNNEEMHRIFEIEADKKRLQELWSLQAITKSQDKILIKEKAKSKKTNTPHYDLVARRKLCNEIADTLKNWKYIQNGIIDFAEDYDLTIDGKLRSTHGKGVRALLFSAFTYSLMSFCVKISLPHPKLLMIDSPLTTFREGATTNDNDEVSGEIQTAFFTNLSKCNKDEQIIILDNKIPPKELWNEINLIQFSGNSSEGRKGFFV